MSQKLPEKQPIVPTTPVNNQSQASQNSEPSQKRARSPGKKRQEDQEEQKQQSDSSSIQVPYDMLICFLCDDPILFTIEVACGHAFCEYCLSEYLLVAKECPICGVKIRQKKGAANKRMDQLVEEFCVHMGPEAVGNLMIRKEQRKKLREQRKIERPQAGTLIDVRDDDYIWRKGRIIRTFNRVNTDQVRIKFVVVEYLENERKEEFALSCSRLARAGYFTNRKDIPHQRGEDQNCEEKKIMIPFQIVQERENESKEEQNPMIKEQKQQKLGSDQKEVQQKQNEPEANQ